VSGIRPHWPKIALAVLTVLIFFSVYHLLFAVWMTAYLRPVPSEWYHRLHLTLTASLVECVLWIACLVWVIRVRGR
jgi:hypothetical protein